MTAGAINSVLAQAAAEPEIIHSVDFPQGDAAWTITIEPRRSPTQEAGKAALPQSDTENPRIKKFDVVRKGNLRRDIATWTDGTTSQYWIVIDPPLALMEEKESGAIVKMELSQLGNLQFDDSTFGWVSKSTYSGIKSYNGEKCRIYERDEDIGEGETRRVSLWVNDATLEPVAWSDGITTALFTFETAVPVDRLVLPPKFAQRVERYKVYNTPQQSYRSIRNAPR